MVFYPSHWKTGAQQRGFTLVELLVALALMAIMAALSWRGLDAVVGAQKRLAQHADDVLTLQTGLAQWSSDLDALARQPNTPSMDWDGRALRLLRRGSQSPSEGLYVVAWAQRRVGNTAYWLRWQSPVLYTRAQLLSAWSQAARWGQNPSDADRRLEVRITPLASWQIFFYRSGAWSNPLSSGDAAPSTSPNTEPSASSVPEGVRLLLTLPPDQAISGLITRDWAQPGLGAGP